MSRGTEYWEEHELNLRCATVEDAEVVRTNLTRCLGLIQGLLLLHRRSQRLFARRATLEVRSLATQYHKRMLTNLP